MPAFSSYNRNGFNSRLRDQGITRQVFSRFGSELTSSTISRSCVAEDSEYSIYVTSKQLNGTTLTNPIITKIDKKGDKIWSFALEDTFSADRYSLYAKGSNVPINGTISINVNSSTSVISFWFSKITATGTAPTENLLAATNNTIFWIVINNDPTRRYKLAFSRNEIDSGSYYRQEIYKNQYDATRFVNDVNSNVLRLGDSFQLFFESDYKYEELPVAVDASNDIIMAFRSYKNLSSILYSDNLNGSSWSTYCGSSSNFTPNTTDLLAPNGTFTASKIVRNSNTSCGSSTSWGRLWNSSSLVSTGTNYTLSIYVRGAVGGEVVSFGIADGNAANYTLTTQWQRITFTANALSTSRGLQIFSSQPNVTFYFWGAKVERTSLIDTERRYKISVVKLTNKGSIKWFSELSLKSDAYIDSFNLTAQSDVKTIITDSNKNIYIGGSAFAGEGPHSEVGNNYGFVVKLDEYGKLIWKKSMYASQGPIPQSATAAAQQITSLSLSPDGFLYASGGSTTVNGAGPCLYKLNSSNGELESGWPILYNLDISLNKFLFLTEIDTDSEGNIYGIVGNLGEPESLFDYSVIKFDSSGNILWCNRYDTNDTTESGYNLVVDKSDLINISGRCDTVLNERPGVLSLNTDSTIAGFRRIRYRREPFIDETSISLRKSKTFTSSSDRNRFTFILNETGFNGFVIGMIQKEKTSVGTYETPLDRYIVNASNPIITDIISILISRGYTTQYQDDNYMRQAFGILNAKPSILDYRILSKVEVPQ
jgi:hypothetical protein